MRSTLAKVPAEPAAVWQIVYSNNAMRFARKLDRRKGGMTLPGLKTGTFRELDDPTTAESRKVKHLKRPVGKG